MTDETKPKKRVRATCSRTPACKGASWYLFCPICCHPLPDAPHPSASRLPLELHMYRHPGEKVSKSTSVHAKVVAPEDTSLFVEDCRALGRDEDGILRERYPDPSRVLLLFPSETSKPLSELPRTSFDKLIVLDGTWTQAKAMYKCLEHAGFQAVTIEFPANQTVESTDSSTPTSAAVTHVSTNDGDANADDGDSTSPSKKQHRDQESATTLSSSSSQTTTTTTTTTKKTTQEPVKTLFWRYQSIGDHCLATIEAVYYFYRDYFSVYEPVGTPYDGRFDSLLYYFRLQYEAVQQNYRENPDKQFTQKKANAEKYIKY
ncbi:UNVERIFIED_CONTAM: DTW domain-containing protein 1 [Siphonaria sp. JEL0065]|nr:DTW domain-containing protein 1 [Siphonaria sp. JEL0065]